MQFCYSTNIWQRWTPWSASSMVWIDNRIRGIGICGEFKNREQ
jgi:hypothetical protein